MLFRSVFNRFRDHKKKNPDAKLIVVDPRATATTKVADLHLAIRPGTDIDLLNGIANLLVEWGKVDREFVAAHTTGFESFEAIVEHYPPGRVAQRGGITGEELHQAATYWAESGCVLSLWSMGINQSREGTAKARTMINLHLMTGQIGRPGAGPFSLTGQPNAMGGREVGGLANMLAAHLDIENADHRDAVKDIWQSPATAQRPGLRAVDMVLACASGQIKAL